MAKNVTKIRGNSSSSSSGDGALPSRDVLMGLHSSASEQNAEMAKIRGELGSSYKEAEKDENLHKGAFKMASRLKRMDDSKRDEFLIHFDHYREQMGIDEGRTRQMFDAPNNEDDDDDDVEVGDEAEAA